MSRTRVRAGALALVVATSCRAAPRRAPASPARADSAVVFGAGRGWLGVHVTNAAGTPITAPAAVLMRGSAMFLPTLDLNSGTQPCPGLAVDPERGWLAFCGVPTGAYLLSVRRIGYLPHRAPVTVRSVADTILVRLEAPPCDIGCDAESAVIVRRRWWQFWRR